MRLRERAAWREAREKADRARARRTAGRASGAELGAAPGPSLPAVFMAFAPMGPEASFFEALDQHRAALLAALRRGGGEPAAGAHLASRCGAPGVRGGGKAPWPRGLRGSGPQRPVAPSGLDRLRAQGGRPGVGATGGAPWALNPRRRLL